MCFHENWEGHISMKIGKVHVGWNFVLNLGRSMKIGGGNLGRNLGKYPEHELVKVTRSREYDAVHHSIRSCVVVAGGSAGFGTQFAAVKRGANCTGTL